MAWHHVIPFALLREVWNRLVDQHIGTQLPEARVAIRQYLLLSDRNQPDLEALIDRMRAENPEFRRAGHPPLRPLEVHEAHRLATAAVWPPWNAVEGPMRRSDDPKDRYIDRFTVGLTSEEAARMRAVEALYGRYLEFVNMGPAPGRASLGMLAGTAARARPVLACSSPIRFRAAMWVREETGLWRKRRME